jgi:hypothetical protein
VVCAAWWKGGGEARKDGKGAWVRVLCVCGERTRTKAPAVVWWWWW